MRKIKKTTRKIKVVFDRSKWKQVGAVFKDTVKTFRFWVGIILIVLGIILKFTADAQIQIRLFGMFFGIGTALAIYSFISKWLATRIRRETEEAMPKATSDMYRFIVYILILTSGIVLGLIDGNGTLTAVATISLAIAILAGIFFIDSMGGITSDVSRKTDNSTEEHLIYIKPTPRKMAVGLLNIQIACFLIGLVAIILSN
ncbi:hypothetical protein LR013_03430 [candidate division NPL-UPA2 bacterium]|nr:hypothetical protein [candidate division NPL-UPA2 bacterium]